MNQRQRQSHRMKIWEEKRKHSFLNLIPLRIRKDLKNIRFSGDDFEDAYIWGPVGSGKTFTACKLLLESAYKRYKNKSISPNDYLFVSVPELLHKIKEAIKEGNSNETLHSYIKVPFLILDDIAVEKMTDWVRETLDYLIDERYKTMRPTVFTSNCSPDDLNNRMEDAGRLVSRIKGSCEVLHLNGKDRRTK